MKKTIKLLLKIFFALLLSILIYFAYLKISYGKLLINNVFLSLKMAAYNRHVSKLINNTDMLFIRI